MTRDHVLLIDNYDSFTWNLADLLRVLGAEVDVVRNDVMRPAEVQKGGASHIVISPGPGSPDREGPVCDVIRHFAGRIPILGVCLGHQAIAVALGGSIEPLDAPIHGRTSSITHARAGLFRSLPPSFQVARYHSLAVVSSMLPPELEADAWLEGDRRVIMSMRHRTEPVFGIQFHPESFLTEHGAELVRAFLETR